MIKAILLDLDNTLYDYETAHKTAISAVLDFAFDKKGIDNKNFIQKFDIARKIVHNELKNTASMHNRLLYFQKTTELLNCFNAPFVFDLYETYWNAFIQNMTLFEGVIDFFEKNKGKKICLITDLTAHIQYRKIIALNISKYINFIVTSEEAGVEKPDEKIFNLALTKLQISPKEAVMIGDSYKKDIKGANALKIKAYYKTTEKINDVETFTSFFELMEKI